ncbi:MAG: hypothetical protein ACI9Y7_000352 [Dokdonia sp.]|jgi:hypothetical protein
MKKKKIKLNFDKKVISNLTKVRGGDGVFYTVTQSQIPDAQSQCLCDIDPSYPNGSGTCHFHCYFIDQSIGDC